MEDGILKPPKSCVHWAEPFLVAAVVPVVWFFLRSRDALELAVILPLSAAALLHGIELWRAPWRGTPRPETPFRAVLRESLIRYLGILASVAFMLFLWWLLREYHTPYFIPLFRALPVCLPFFLAIAAVCVLYTEWRLGPKKNPGRQYWAVLSGRRKEADGCMIRDDLINAAVRVFFVPANFLGTFYHVQQLHDAPPLGLATPWPDAVMLVKTMLAVILTSAILPGYVFSSRLFGTEIKSVSHSWFGWLVTLACYPPLSIGIGRWFKWNGGEDLWVAKLSGAPFLLYAAGGGIILCEALRYYSAAILSIRSSMLSNRGIVTNGPFRFCKHPVYVVRILSMFLMTVPFLNGGTFSDCLRSTLAFFFLCGIFMMRSLAEEKLLSEDPDYVAYALWMDQHSVFSWLGRLFPVFSFRWRLERWARTG